MSPPLRKLLASVDLFAALDADALHRVSESGRLEHWRDGALVLEEGAYGPRMLVILEGTVEILRRDPAGVQRPVSQLSSGQLLGEMSLLLDLPRTATVRARGDVMVFALDRRAFRDLLDTNEPAFLRLGFELSRELARRVMALNDSVMGLLAEAPELRTRFGSARQELFELWEQGP